MATKSTKSVKTTKTVKTVKATFTLDGKEVTRTIRGIAREGNVFHGNITVNKVKVPVSRKARSRKWALVAA